MKKILSGIIIFLLFSGCSLVKLGYNNADWLLTWKLDGYFNLTSHQKNFIENSLEHHLEWHRSQELPRYSILIDETVGRIKDGISGDDYDWVLTQMQDTYQRIIIEILPDATTFLMGLQPKQIEYYEKQVAETNEDFIEFLSLPEEEQIKKRNENIVEHMETWFGDLNNQQKEKVKQLASTLPLRYTLFNEDRLRRQKQFIALLKSKPPKEEFMEKLKSWFLDFEQCRSDEYKKISSAFNEAAKKMTIEVDNMLTPEQKNHAFDRVHKYQLDIIELAANR